MRDSLHLTNPSPPSQPLAGTAANLLVDLRDPRWSQNALHEALQRLDAQGVRPLRLQRADDGVLAWLDEAFNGSYSSEAAGGGLWLAQTPQSRVGFAAFGAPGLGFHWLRRWQRAADVGLLGPFGVTVHERRDVAQVLLLGALFSLRERGFRSALIPAVSDERLVRSYEREAGARVVERFDPTRGNRRWRATILASGNGSNFQSVVDAAAAGALPLEVVGLVANRASAFALERAARAGIPAQAVVWRRADETRAAYDERVAEAVAATRPDVVLLLGWMHVLPASFVAAFPQVLNLHPAFLPLDPSYDAVTLPDGSEQPAYRGPRAVDDALTAGAGWIGASVHRVNVAVDRGAVLARAPLALLAGEAREVLDVRLHALEHRVLAASIRRWAFEQP